jgi:predicted phage baseplate assembly protein
VLQGSLYDTKAGAPAQTVATEPGVLDGAPVVDATYDITTVKLKNPLAQAYARAGAVLLANIVDVSQGETVRDEVLGSGDGSAFQSFELKQKPLTYLPAADPEGLSAVQSTLLVTVNGVRWKEQPTLLESAPNAQEYITAQDDGDQTTVQFGDGIDGARAPTGRDNIHARYRKGLGTSGNVGAGAIAQLIDNQPGLQKVTNPLASLGGADREHIDQIRTNAPASLRTFGRAVSVDDYAALARSYPGVAKASAAWMLRDPLTLKAIPNPYIQLTIATADQTPLAQQPTFARQIRTFLDRRRDSNVTLRIVDFTPVYADVAAMIDVDDRYPQQATLNAARAALSPGLNPDGTAGFFAFERLNFGQSLHLSAVYAALQAVPGVRDATITTFRLVGDPPATVRSDIFIRPTELVVIANDPEDTSNQKGKLTIMRSQGGFIDL